MIGLARITMRLDNAQLQRVQERIRDVPDAVREGAQEAVAESGEAIRSDVERNIRVDRGHLKEHVAVRLIGALGLTADIGWFDDKSYYSYFNEFGTSSIAADPVLTRASEDERERFPERVQGRIGDRL